MRVLGVDPGLTRCGLGVIEGEPGRALRLIGTDVIRTPAGDDIGARLLALEIELDQWLARHRAGRRRGGARLQPAQRAHGHGHRAGWRGRDRLRRPARRARRAAHAERGQGGRHRQRPGGQAAGDRDGHQAAPAGRPAPPGRQRGRAGPGHLSSVARHRTAAAGRGQARCGQPARRHASSPPEERR